jgi:hypothetical protein
MKLSRLAIVAVAIPILSSCQTPSQTSYSETTKPVEDLRVQLLIEFCRGQTPESVTRAEYDSWPQAAKDYATSNVAQWIAAGCKI